MKWEIVGRSFGSMPLGKIYHHNNNKLARKKLLILCNGSWQPKKIGKLKIFSDGCIVCSHTRLFRRCTRCFLYSSAWTTAAPIYPFKHHRAFLLLFDLFSFLLRGSSIQIWLSFPPLCFWLRLKCRSLASNHSERWALYVCPTKRHANSNFLVENRLPFDACPILATAMAAYRNALRQRVDSFSETSVFEAQNSFVSSISPSHRWSHRWIISANRIGD